MTTTLIPGAPDERAPELARRRELKKARSAHAYVRGSTHRFYEWLATKRGRAVPKGPPIWICGDCHIGNLGPVAHADGRVEIQLRDLDQTVIGNPAHDVIRLGLSLAMLARGSDLPGVTTALMIEELARAYESVLEAYAESPDVVDVEPAKPVRLLLEQATQRRWRHLLSERLGDEPTFPTDNHFWPLTPAERDEIRALFATEAARKLVTSLEQRDDDARIKVVDAAFWVKGCSSLGGFRAAVLVKVGKGDIEAEDGGLCLVDIKEARAATAPRASRAGMPRHNGERIVTGARHLAPFLGQRMMSADVAGRQVFLRELLPQDVKIELEQISEREARDVARYLAHVVGVAHARQLEPAARAAWATALRGRHSKSIEAPTWLWGSIVDLVAIHESAYLEHCRAFALVQERSEPIDT